MDKKNRGKKSHNLLYSENIAAISELSYYKQQRDSFSIKKRPIKKKNLPIIKFSGI